MNLDLSQINPALIKGTQAVTVNQACHSVCPGFLGGYYFLHFSVLTSVLFASLFSSHTLISNPLISKLGIAKNLSVNITVGGTMITSFVSMSSGQRIADADKENTPSGINREKENILLAVNYEQTVEKLVNLSLLVRAKHNDDRLWALNVVNDEKNESSVKNAKKNLHIAVDTAAAADVKVLPLTRYDNDVATGISNVITERQ